MIQIHCITPSIYTTMQMPCHFVNKEKLENFMCLTARRRYYFSYTDFNWEGRGLLFLPCVFAWFLPITITVKVIVPRFYKHPPDNLPAIMNKTGSDSDRLSVWLSAVIKFTRVVSACSICSHWWSELASTLFTICKHKTHIPATYCIHYSCSCSGI